MRVKNMTKNLILAADCKKAGSFFSRFRGLMFKKGLPKSGGLLLTPCNSIHMLFMKFSIDALFIDKNNFVVHMEKNLKPWKISKIIFKAVSVIELPAGIIDATGTEVGDKISVE